MADLLILSLSLWCMLGGCGWDWCWVRPECEFTCFFLFPFFYFFFLFVAWFGNQVCVRGCICLVYLVLRRRMTSVSLRNGLRCVPDNCVMIKDTLMAVAEVRLVMRTFPPLPIWIKHCGCQSVIHLTGENPTHNINIGDDTTVEGKRKWVKKGLWTKKRARTRTSVLFPLVY